MSIGEKLTKARGNTPRQIVATAVGVSVSAISNYENDIRIPCDDVKKKLAGFYETPIGVLFYGEDDTI